MSIMRKKWLQKGQRGKEFNVIFKHEKDISLVQLEIYLSHTYKQILFSYKETTRRGRVTSSASSAERRIIV